MAGIFFVERVREEEPVAEEAQDLEVVRMVLMDILPWYPEVLAEVESQVGV